MKYITNTSKIAIAVAIIFLLTLPFVFPSRFVVYLAAVTLIMAIGTLSMELIMGYTGQASLAQGGFFGIGAYIYALIVLHSSCNPWLAICLGAIITAIVGYLVGYLALRTRGAYFAICTLAFNVILVIAVENWEEITGGHMGLRGIKGLQQMLPLEKMSSLLTTEGVNYYIALLFFLMILWVMYKIVVSFLGKSMIAVRENEELAGALGINTVRVKTVSFSISTFFAAVAGALFVSTMGFLGPESISYHLTFDFLTFTVIGGQGTIIGPLIGTFILQIAATFLQSVPEYRLLIFGVLLIITIIFLPNGLVGAFKSLHQRRKAGKDRKG
jgi:branched-chain amino acid transport system permease protein